MAISYTWEISNVNTYINYTDEQEPSNTQSDVIYNVHWRLTGEDDANNDVDGNPQLGSVYGETKLDITNLSSFIAFDSVTSSNVQSWVESSLGNEEVASLKSDIDAQIAEKITPTTESKIIGE